MADVIVLPPSSPRAVLEMLDWYQQRRSMIESHPVADMVDLRVPLELRTVHDAVWARMRDLARQAESLGEESVQIRVPNGPALDRLIRWGAERLTAFDGLSKQMTPMPGSKECFDLYKLFFESALEQLTPEGGSE